MVVEASENQSAQHIGVVGDLPWMELPVVAKPKRFYSCLAGLQVQTQQPIQVGPIAWVNAAPISTVTQELIAYSSQNLAAVGLESTDLLSSKWQACLTGGGRALTDQPYAMNYVGHQFGYFAGQLGDGRAVNIGETLTTTGRLAWQLKGVGPTVFSRQGDGFAVLRSSVREFIGCEAMQGLNIPTTLALSLYARDHTVLRDPRYDGSVVQERAATLCRLAPSFLRFGSFELYAMHGDWTQLRQCVGFAVEQYWPEILQAHHRTEAITAWPPSAWRALLEDWLTDVVRLTAELVAAWQSVGFVHGVLNTDNLSIHGLTLDFGPYGFLEGVDQSWTPNSSDQAGRYAYGQQVTVCRWNLERLVYALACSLGEPHALNTVLADYEHHYEQALHRRMAIKLGLRPGVTLAAVGEATTHWFAMLQTQQADFTRAHRALATVCTLPELIAMVRQNAYRFNESKLDFTAKRFWSSWQSLVIQDLSERQVSMNSVNPLFVPRNWQLQQAIARLEAGDARQFEQLCKAARDPFDAQAIPTELVGLRPDIIDEYATCLSCSS